MPDRRQEIHNFLSAHGYGAWDVSLLAGDASARRYLRLKGPGGQQAVLMDWPPEEGGDVRPFARLAEYLLGINVSAPRIFAQDPDTGLMLLEDLGDALFTEIIAEDATKERPLYEAATDLLVHLHNAPVPDLPPLGPRIMSEMTALAFTEYREALTGDPAEASRARFENRFEDILRQCLTGDMVFVHRDFHAQNLLWLPERAGISQVGVIDFQDARVGHRCYDLVSLLQDARRDVPAGVEMQMIDRYIAATDVDEAAFRQAYAVTGVQRNMRILGIFVRLARSMGKPQYLHLIPRVWTHFERGLNHPALALVADELLELFPAPDADALERLRS